jgi:hypothetical protein
VFKEANRLGADYRIVLLSPTGWPITTNLGIELTGCGAVPEEPAPDTYLVPGFDRFPRAAPPNDLTSVSAHSKR